MTQKEKMAKLRWLHENRGILSTIARKLNISPTSVREVYWRMKTSSRVHGELALAGAPGFVLAAIKNVGEGFDVEPSCAEGSAIPSSSGGRCGLPE